MQARPVDQVVQGVDVVADNELAQAFTRSSSRQRVASPPHDYLLRQGVSHLSMPLTSQAMPMDQVADAALNTWQQKRADACTLTAQAVFKAPIVATGCQLAKGQLHLHAAYVACVRGPIP